MASTPATVCDSNSAEYGLGKAAENDSYLHPELRERELQEYEEERARTEEDGAWRMDDRPRFEE